MQDPVVRSRSEGFHRSELSAALSWFSARRLLTLSSTDSRGRFFRFRRRTSSPCSKADAPHPQQSASTDIFQRVIGTLVRLSVPGD
jgi:hypothetical protein